MRKRTHRILSALVSLFLFLLAVWAIRRSLGNQNPRDILHSIAELPTARVGVALLLTSVNYLFMAGIDLLASRFAGHPISFRRIFIPSFIGATFQYNAGVFGGTAVRFRLYSSLGFTTHEIGRMLFFTFLSFTIGYCTLTGIALVIDPLTLPGTVRYPWWPEAAGTAMLLLVGLYFWSCWRGKPLRLVRWQLAVPRLRIGLLQFLLALCDWTVAAGILFVLLPPEGRSPFPIFVVVFMLAHNIGIASNTPGGLGVFEATFLHLLPTESAPTQVLAALLAYRGIYYALPLLAAAALLGQRELTIRRDRKLSPAIASNWEVIAKGMHEPDKRANVP